MKMIMMQINILLLSGQLQCWKIWTECFLLHKNVIWLLVLLLILVAEFFSNWWPFYEHGILRGGDHFFLPVTSVYTYINGFADKWFTQTVIWYTMWYNYHREGFENETLDQSCSWITVSYIYFTDNSLQKSSFLCQGGEDAVRLAHQCCWFVILHYKSIVNNHYPI